MGNIECTQNTALRSWDYPVIKSYDIIVIFFFLVLREPVGVADRNTIPNAQMTASTVFSASYQSCYSRLNENRGAQRWCPKTRTDRTDFIFFLSIFPVRNPESLNLIGC